MMALAAVFPLGIDGHHVHRSQFPVVCQVRGDDDDDDEEQDCFLTADVYSCCCQEIESASASELLDENPTHLMC